MRRVLKDQESQVAFISSALVGDPLMDSSLAQEIRKSSPATRSIVFLDPVQSHSMEEGLYMLTDSRVR